MRAPESEPQNAGLLNLKAQTLYKMERIQQESAAATQEEAEDDEALVEESTNADSTPGSTEVSSNAVLGSIIEYFEL